MISSAFLYSVSSRDRVKEDAYLGCSEGENYEQKSDQTEQEKREPRISAPCFIFIEKPSFVYIHCRRRDKEDRGQVCGEVPRGCSGGK